MDTNNVLQAIEELLLFAQEKLSLESIDVLYARNMLLEELELESPGKPVKSYTTPKEKMIEPIMVYAKENLKRYEDTPSSKIKYEAKIFGFVTPSPSYVMSKFDAIAANKNIEKATDYLFNISQENNYIRMLDINKNIKWSHRGINGNIEITINLSKPEKDPKEIKAAQMAKNVSYPACPLCKENLGFPGNATKAARQTLRFIPIPLNNENWFLQYSPYQYYNKHIIAFAENHTPMNVTTDTYRRLLDFVDLFPHFFLGSNAALPIVGGSILAHDHYQGGAKVLPMMSANPKYIHTSRKLKSLKVSIVDWYNSVIRVEGENKEEIIQMCEMVMNAWNSYNNEALNIISETNGEPHNAITPIARKENETYIVDMILRNNRCDEKHPFGIFHPCEKLHNIKKEGIGIIEVMGLFILPGRLKNEIEEIKNITSGETIVDFAKLTNPEHPLNKHMEMIMEISKQSNGEKLSIEESNAMIFDYINKACEEILLTTGVFKQTDEGEKAFLEFMKKDLKLTLKK